MVSRLVFADLALIAIGLNPDEWENEQMAINMVGPNKVQIEANYGKNLIDKLTSLETFHSRTSYRTAHEEVFTFFVQSDWGKLLHAVELESQLPGHVDWDEIVAYTETRSADAHKYAKMIRDSQPVAA